MNKKMDNFIFLFLRIDIAKLVLEGVIDYFDNKYGKRGYNYLLRLGFVVFH